MSLDEVGTYNQCWSTILVLCGRPRVGSSSCYSTLCPRLLPWEISGLDYCLALHSIFPRSVDLNLLCWVVPPAVTQLEDNLSLFITACSLVARSHDDFPHQSLSCNALWPSRKNIVHHIRVQWFLTTLAQKYRIHLEEACAYSVGVRVQRQFQTEVMSADTDADAVTTARVRQSEDIASCSLIANGTIAFDQISGNVK